MLDSQSRLLRMFVWPKPFILPLSTTSIPLAKKLKECGVFGVSSDEYLNYALENRQEWEAKGEGIVKSLIEKYAASSQAPVGMVL